MLPSLYALPFYDFDLRASHARILLPAALASVPFGFVLVRVRVRARCARSCMDFTRSVENVELHQSRAWTHAVLRASEAKV